MRLLVLVTLSIAAFSLMVTVKSSLAESQEVVYLEVRQAPPNRHVIAMDSMKKCRRAAEYSSARCVTRLPQFPDSSVGVFRSLDWHPKPFFGVSVKDPTAVLKGKDFGPAYLVVWKSPPNRHVIAMRSMKRCLKAAAYTSATCLEKLPNLPDASVGVLRTLN